MSRSRFKITEKPNQFDMMSTANLLTHHFKTERLARVKLVYVHFMQCFSIPDTARPRNKTQGVGWFHEQEPCITSTSMAQNKVGYKEHTSSFLKLDANDISDRNCTSSQCMMKSGILYSVPCCRGNHHTLAYPGSPEQNCSTETCQ